MTLEDNFSFMTLTRAREVFWLSSNYRPMGELYDSGFLTQNRLEWGKNNAYDQKIRAACACLLKQKKCELQTHVNKGRFPKNLDEARAVEWPFNKNIKKAGRTIGELWDLREITKKDLAFAIDNAWDEQVRIAAHIVLSNSLKIETAKLSTSKGALKITAPSENYMEKEREFLSMYKGAWLGAVLVICFICLISIFGWLIYTNPFAAIVSFINKANVIVVVFFVVFAVIMLLIMNFIFKHTIEKKIEKKIDSYDLKIENHRQGQKGEDKVINVMREALDGSCHVFRNLILPEKKFDMDAVLVSPQGIYVFEIKNWTGKYQNEGDNWVYQAGKKLKKVKDGPSIQAKRNAAMLAEFLDPIFCHNKQKKWVSPIVVMANADMICHETKPSVPIWRVEHLSEELGNIPEARVISEKAQKEISERLQELYK